MADEFYSNRELFEKIEELKTDIAELRKDMEVTNALIRDYNDLRKKVEDVNAKMGLFMWAMPVVISALGLLFVFLNYIGRY